MRFEAIRKFKMSYKCLAYGMRMFCFGVVFCGFVVDCGELWIF